MNTSSRPNQQQREQMRADGIVCPTCLYFGLAHQGEHIIPTSGAGAVLAALDRKELRG